MMTFASIAAILTISAGAAAVALFAKDTVNAVKANQSAYAVGLGA